MNFRKRRASVALGGQGLSQPFAVAVGSGTYTGDGTGSKIIDMKQRLALVTITNGSTTSAIILISSSSISLLWMNSSNTTRVFQSATPSTYVSGTTLDVGKLQADSPAGVAINTNAVVYTWTVLS